MRKGKRLLAALVLLLAASGLIAALWIHSPDATHPTAYDEHPVGSPNHAVVAIWVPVPEVTGHGPFSVSYPTAIEY
jgi:hypothetical protein